MSKEKSDKKPWSTSAQQALTPSYEKYMKLKIADAVKADKIRSLTKRLEIWKTRRDELETHIQKKTEENIKLFARVEGLEREIAQLNKSVKEKDARLAELEYLAQVHGSAAVAASSAADGLVELIKESNLQLKPKL